MIRITNSARDPNGGSTGRVSGSRDPNGTPQSDYDGTHISVDVRQKAPILRDKANQDRTGDGWKYFGSLPPK